MKKRTWIILALIALCIVVFVFYQTVDRLRTDTKAPVITVSEEVLQLSVQTADHDFLRGITAKDNKDGDVSDSIVVEGMRLVNTDGTVEVTYAAFDSAGNVAKAKRQILFTDYQSPLFDLTAPLIYSQGTPVSVLGRIRATDLLDGDISRRVKGNSLSESMITGLGIHDVAVRVSNSLGDTVELILPVEVYPAGTYQASLELTDYLIYLSVGERFDFQNYLSQFTVGRETVMLSSGIPEHFSLQTSGTVNTQEPGVYSVSYTITEQTDGRNVRGYSRLIVIVEE